ncbi:MAG TPA: response regulator transcription factor [Noviherbaspirillum sp.]|uniref:response regulator transcription factor n=1 Tax=Noviherbaspirillum sp. TaxID=1926288 RepID=UPI002F9453D5
MQSDSDIKRVLIVEDHALVAFALQQLIHRMDRGIVTTTCDCASSAMTAIESDVAWHRVFLAPDIPGADGLSLARRFCLLGLADRCVLLARSGNPSWIHEARISGMLGYLLCTAPLADFTSDLHAVIEGRPVFAAPDVRPAPIRLTPRQEEILLLLREGVASKQIAARLHISEGTVNNHVATLIRLFGASNRAQAVSKAVALGYLQWRSY